MGEKDTFFRTKNGEGYLTVQVSIDAETTPKLSGLKQQSFLHIPQFCEKVKLTSDLLANMSHPKSSHSNSSRCSGFAPWSHG